MREVLFRGKRRDNGEWTYGSLLKPIFGAKPAILQDASVDDSCRLDFEYHFIDPDTVGQYAGMEDCSGKKIFEGDIMKTAITGLTHHTGVVEFADGAFGLRCTDGGAFFLCFVAGSYAIIGNIHDNPELLEEAAPC